jgi:uncharacterized repeat protein (TIGR01451 family)
LEKAEDRLLLSSTPTGFLTGTVFADNNGTGALDYTPPPDKYLSGVTVNLYQVASFSSPLPPSPFQTTTTDANGQYLFSGLAPGMYVIQEVTPAGSTQETPQILSQLNQASVGSNNTIDVTLADPSSVFVNYNGFNNVDSTDPIVVKVSVDGFSTVDGSPNENAIGEMNASLGTAPGNTDLNPGYITYCADDLHSVSFDGGEKFQVLPQPVTSITNDTSGTTTISADHAGRIAYLFNHYDGASLNSIQAGALQLAIWELIYDADPDNVPHFDQGNFQATGPDTGFTTQATFNQVIAQATAYFNESTGKSETAVYLNYAATLPSFMPNGFNGQGVLATESYNFGNSTPNLVVTKTADQSTLAAGQTAGFTVTIANTGTGAAANVTLTDPLPAGAGNDVNWTIDTTTGNPSDFTINGPVGNQTLGLSPSFVAADDSLAPGASIKVHITGLTSASDATNSVNPALNVSGISAYTVLYEGTGNNQLSINNDTIFGNIGVGGGQVQFNGPGIIKGRMDFSAANSGQFHNTNGSNVGPTSVNYSISAVTAAINAVNSLNTTLAGLSGTNISFNNSNQTVNESSGTLHTVGGVTYRVFNVTSYSETNQNTVTINGDGSGDPVVFNFAYGSNVNLGGQVALGGTGLSADLVMWNFTNTGKQVNLNNNGGTFLGVIIAPKEQYQSNSSNLDGRVYGGAAGNMQIVSGANVYGPMTGLLANTATVSASGDTNQPGEQSSATVAVVGQAATGPLANHEAATIDFWHNNNGQALINSFNGGSTATKLGNWLAGLMPNTFGASAGANNLTGKTNAQVAAYDQNLYGMSGTQRAYAQVLATALAVYATDSSLAGGTMASSDGFIVGNAGTGTGSKTYNVGSSGAAIGVPNNTTLTVLQILQDQDARNTGGAGVIPDLSDSNTLFNGINMTGGITNAALNDSGLAFTPAQIRTAYGINSLALDGTGQTIAIVDAYNNPNLFASMDTFDAEFGLRDSGPSLYDQYGPASSFLTVLDQNGRTTSLPGTDPSGAGTENWELEEAIDVEWVHAIAPGARIILVEASSQSLSDLMTAVATAAGQPGVSVVSMSWGFPEGQAVFAADEANYDRVFNVPDVTFLASTGDYGTADPEYPAFSPDVVAVGGTSLSLNGDNSYHGETGWGSLLGSTGMAIGSGGGLSLYEPEPSYQHGVQSLGSRTTPDVSFDADPATGAWIADSYNLDPSNPFEVVGGTSVSAPALAGVIALVNQGRVTSGAATLNSSSPTESQQALYSLPQSDYNMITSGSNGYTATAGYNLVTGLGTPVANRLVPDLVAYQGPGTSYAGPLVGPLQDDTLTSTWTGGGGPTNAFNVFSAITVSSGGFGQGSGQGPGAASASPISTALGAPGQGVVASPTVTVTTPVAAASTRLGLETSSPEPNGPVQVLGMGTNSSLAGYMATANLMAPAAPGLAVSGLATRGESGALQAGALLLPASSATKGAVSDNALLVAAANPSLVTAAATGSITIALWPSVLPGLENVENTGRTDRLDGFTPAAPLGVADGHDPTLAAPTVMRVTPLPGLAVPGNTGAVADADALAAALIQEGSDPDGTPDEADQRAEREREETSRPTLAVILGAVALAWRFRAHLGRRDNDREGNRRRHRSPEPQRGLPGLGPGSDPTP